MSDIRDLVESYYNDVYIEEEVLDEQGRGTVTGSNPNVFRPTPSAPGSRRGAAPVPSSSSTSSVTTQQGTRTGSNPNVYTPTPAPYRPGGGRQQANMPSRPQIGSLPPSAKQVTQYPQGVPTGVGGGNAGASTSVKPVAAPAARPLPAGKPNLNLRVTPPAAAKVAPTAPAPGTKSAGPESIKPKTTNPLLTGGELSRMRQASQMRQSGINVTSDQIAAAQRTKPSTTK